MNRRQIFATAVAAGAAVATPIASAQQRRRARRVEIRTRDGVRLFHREAGDGQPIVFLSSGALPSDLWNYQTVALADQGFRCIAYDRRGHGQSDDPGRGFDFDTLADDLAAVLETLNLDNVTLVGHSMAAGELTRYMTRHHGARVAKLLYASPAATPGLGRYVDLAVFESVRAQLMRDFPGALADGLPRLFLLPDTPASTANWVADMMLRTSLPAVIGCHRAFTGADFRAELPRIDTPTLVVHGARDLSTPIDFTARPTAALIPNATLKIYEDAPHGLMLTHIDQFNADIAAFARS